MAGDYTISIRAVAKIIEAARPSGVEPEELCEAGWPAPDLCDDQDLRIPFSQFVELYERAAELTGDDAFGLHIGERTTPKMFDVLGYAGMNSPSFGEALRRLIRFNPVWCDGTSFDLRDDGREARLEYHYQITEPPAEGRRQDCEATFSIIVASGRAATGVDWAPQEVWFEHTRPRDTSEHERILRSPVRFSQPVNCIIFDRETLALPVIKADPVLCEVLDRHAAELLAKLPPQGRFLDRARRALGESLRGGDSSLEALARRLSMSTRSLQRRLSDEGTSYKDLLDEVRSHSPKSTCGRRRWPSARSPTSWAFQSRATFIAPFGAGPARLPENTGGRFQGAGSSLLGPVKPPPSPHHFLARRAGRNLPRPTLFPNSVFDANGADAEGDDARREVAQDW
ncbi:MAG: AraC family transcriptional regulator, partial [Acidobacteriota bacterium]|nr:AraC family transcriptional regulator [Acidobacteriota bacterium]